MTPADAALVLAKAGTYDNRRPDEQSAVSWSQALADVGLADAMTAVVAHYRESRQWVMPDDVRRRVAAMRADRLAVVPEPVFPAELAPAANAAALVESRVGAVTPAGTEPSAQPRLVVVPLTFKDACDFVTEHHRHHKRPVGHKFSIGVTDEAGQLRGVVIVGRPVARHYDDGQTAEVIRSATDGCPNANSALYAAAWRTAKAMGYTRLITYTQAGESGASLRGAGWTVIGQRTPRKGWDTPSRARTGNGNDGIERTLWEAS